MKTTSVDQRRLTRWRALLSVLVVTLALSLGLGAASPVQAAPSGTWSSLSATGGKLPYSHAYRSSTGTTGYCGFSSLMGPAWLKENVSYGAGSLVQPGTKLSNGYAFTGDNYHNAAYVLNRFGETTDPQRASTVDYLLWAFSNRATSSEYVNKTIAGQSAAFIQYVQAIEARSKAESGPYTAQGTIKHKGTTAVASGLGIKSRSGNWVKTGAQGLPDAQLKVTLTNAKWPDGKTSFAYNLPTGMLEDKTFTIIDPTKPVGIKIEGIGLPSSQIFIHQPAKNTYQPLIIPTPTKTSVTKSASDQPLVLTPKVTTSTSEVEKLPGLEGYRARDQITIAGGTPNASTKAVADLYYTGVPSPAVSASAPAGAVKKKSLTKTVALNASGAATFWTDWANLPHNTEVGHYTWVVTVSGTNMTTVVSSYGVPQETFKIIESEFEISLQTVSIDEAGDHAREVAPGTQVSDLLKVTDQANILQLIPAPVTSTQYGPFLTKPQGAIPAGAPVHFQTLTTINVRGQHKTALSPALATPGYYVWGYSYPNGLDPDTGLVVYKGVDNRLIYEDEITFVPWQPRIETEAFASTIQAGETNGDTLRLTGAKPGATYKATVQAWGPLDEQPTQTATVPDKTPLANTVEVTLQADANGEATARTGDLVFESGGWYTFTAAIPATPESAAYQSPFGVPAETFSVIDIATLATPDAMVGQPFTDTAILTGDAPEGSSIQFELWREHAGSDIAKDELVTITERVPVSKRGEYVSPEVVVTEAGRYYFRERFYLPKTEEPSHYGEPRLPGESTRVHKVYTNATRAASPGTPVRDSAYLQGDIPQNAYVVFRVFRQTEGDDAEKDEQVLVSNKIFIWGDQDGRSTGVAWETSETDSGVDPNPCANITESDPDYSRFCSATKDVEVLPIGPTVLRADNCDEPGTLELPNAIGVEYHVAATGSHRIVTATAQEGFVFAEDAISTWELDLAGEGCPPDEPETSTIVTMVDNPSLLALVAPPEGAVVPLDATTRAVTEKIAEALEPGEEAVPRPPRSEFTVFSPVLAMETPGTYYSQVEYGLDGSDEPLYVDARRMDLETIHISTVKTVATQNASVGEVILDRAIVDGVVPRGSYLVFEAFSSPTETDPQKFAATKPEPVFTSKKIEVTELGEYTSDAAGDTFIPEEPGTVFWRYSLYQANGDLISQGAIGDEGETSRISRVTTKATESVDLGKQISDSAVIEGPVPEGAYLTFDVFGPDLHGSVTEFAQTNPQSVFTSERVPVSGPGEYRSNATGSTYTPAAAGTYYWMYTLYSDNGELISQGELGDPGETSRVTAPPDQPQLPVTGASIPVIVLIGLIVGGGGLYLRVRRSL